jgi:hypothetical protein
MAGFSKTQLLHTTHMITRALSDVFGDRNIGSGIWSARSPNLNPCDFFFFWGCLKDKVTTVTLRTEELKENICRDISNIHSEQLQRVNQNVFRRC